MVAFLFQRAAVRPAAAAARCSVLGTIGFAAVGTLFAAMLVRARTRDVMLPILLYPITIPVIIAGVRGTSALLAVAARRADGDAVDRAAGVLRRRVRHAVAVDVRAADDGVASGGRRTGGQAGTVPASGPCSQPAVVEQSCEKLFVPLLIVTAAMFAYAPIAIANAPYESTMLLVQKIFYFHLPTWMALTAAVTVCGVASAIYLFKGTPAADRHRGRRRPSWSSIFGAIGLVSGSLWGRKAWGVWWQWDARLTMAFLLELIFIGYLLVRKYGGPGSEKLAAAMGIFGARDGAVRLQVGGLVAHDPSARRAS